MTKEQYTQARDYVHDIELLDSIIYSYNKIIGLNLLHLMDAKT